MVTMPLSIGWLKRLITLTIHVGNLPNGAHYTQKCFSPNTVTKYKVILCAVLNYTIPLLIFPKCKLENSVKVPEEDKIAKLEESSVCQNKKEGKKTHL